MPYFLKTCNDFEHLYYFSVASTFAGPNHGYFALDFLPLSFLTLFFDQIKMYCCHITCIGVFCSYHNVISLKRIWKCMIFKSKYYETKSHNWYYRGESTISGKKSRNLQRSVLHLGVVLLHRRARWSIPSHLCSRNARAILCSLFLLYYAALFSSAAVSQKWPASVIVLGNSSYPWVYNMWNWVRKC